MKCVGCNKTLEVGDRYIEDTPSGFLKEDSPSEVDDILSSLFDGKDGKVYYCDECTEPGGDYIFNTVYGDEDENG